MGQDTYNKGMEDAFAALVEYRQWTFNCLKWESPEVGGGGWLFTDMPCQLSFDVKDAMRNNGSCLYDAVNDLLAEKGIDGLRLIMNKYFSPYFELLEMKDKGMVDEAVEVEGLGVGNIFLQNISDIALAFGIDGADSARLTRKTPRGWGDRVSPEDTIQGCQAGNDALICNIDEGVCNLDISKQIKNQPQLSDILPEILRTEETIPIFQKAVDTGLVDINGKKLKWNRTKSMLAYFMGHFFVNGVFPDTIYSSLFDVQRLGQAYYRLADNKHGEGGKPRGYEEIDKLFE